MSQKFMTHYFNFEARSGAANKRMSLLLYEFCNCDKQHTKQN